MSSAEPWIDARAILEAANLGVLIEWPNETEVQPGEQMWLRVDMAGDGYRPIEMGPDAAWREEGELFVDILVPSGHGTMEARLMAKRITNLFRGRGPRAVIWRRASLGIGSSAEDRGGNWWMLPISISYELSQ